MRLDAIFCDLKKKRQSVMVLLIALFSRNFCDVQKGGRNGSAEGFEEAMGVVNQMGAKVCSSGYGDIKLDNSRAREATMQGILT